MLGHSCYYEQSSGRVGFCGINKTAIHA